MYALIQTLVDITFLRKGPEDIPHSALLLYLCVGLWLAGLVAMTVLVPSATASAAWISLASWVLGMMIYVSILNVMGRLGRATQTLAALAGCGAMITFAMLAILLLMTPLVGSNPANLGAILVLFWSVPVKGHIIARAIEQHWYVGIAIAMSIFIIQFVFSSTFSPEPVS